MFNNILYCIEHNNNNDVNYPPPQNQQQQPEQQQQQQELNMVDSMINFQAMQDLVSPPFQPSSPQSPFLLLPQQHVLLEQSVTMETVELLLGTTNSPVVESQQPIEVRELTPIPEQPIEVQQTPMEPTTVEQQTPMEPTIVEQQIDTLPQEIEQQEEKEKIIDLYLEATEGILECLGEWSEDEDIT